MLRLFWGLLLVYWYSIRLLFHYVVTFLTYLGFKGRICYTFHSLLNSHIFNLLIPHLIPLLHPFIIFFLTSKILTSFVLDTFLIFLHFLNNIFFLNFLLNFLFLNTLLQFFILLINNTFISFLNRLIIIK